MGTHVAQGGKSDKEFRTELRKVVHELRVAEGDEKTKKTRTLRLIARKLADRAIEGEVPAITAIRDSLDGKPAQAVEVDVQVQITKIERVIIEPTVIEGQVVEDKSDS